MKRLIIAALLTIGISSAYTQDIATGALNYTTLEKKLKKSNAAIVDGKDKLKAGTWFDRGELFQDIHNVNIELLRLGMEKTEAKLYMREPNEVKTLEEGGKMTEQHVYDRITLIYENGVLRDWNETQVIHPDPLPEALAAYVKALKFDEKNKLDKKVRENLDRLKIQAEGDAIRHFTHEDYDNAIEKFELILAVSETDVYEGMIDSVIVYNAALAAKKAGNHEKSAQFFEKSVEIDYGGDDTYYMLKNEYISLEDSAKALDALERGYTKYPDSTLIIFELVNYHLTSGNNEEGMRYLEIAEEKAGDNPSIYFAKGTLFEKLGNKENAMESYRQALEVDPEFFNGWFNIGALHFNNAVEMYEQANALEDLDEYNKAKTLADEELRKALQPLEKAHQIKPEDKDCLTTLSTIYYRLQMTEERDAVQTKLDNLQNE